ncbi:hypothetical protein LEMLEM_LOCUS27215 [Lemmus lemmus]
MGLSLYKVKRCSDSKYGAITLQGQKMLTQEVWGYHSTRSKAPRLFHFLKAFITRPSKPWLFFLMTGSHSNSFIFLGCTCNRHETVEPHDSQVT